MVGYPMPSLAILTSTIRQAWRYKGGMMCDVGANLLESLDASASSSISTTNGRQDLQHHTAVSSPTLLRRQPLLFVAPVALEMSPLVIFGRLSSAQFDLI
jgi:hypothetical protein